jgi:DNA-binding MarR family transcriptional regulator
MVGAWRADMDAVLFEMKKAHLAGARFGRMLLKPFGEKMTPARFNLMLALHGGKGMRQNDLWKLLGVVRSVVSEMLDSLKKLNWVKAIRAADGRTRLISLTRYGRMLFEAAFAWCIRNGNMGCEVNRALEGPKADKDPNSERYKASKIAVKLTEYFGWVLEPEVDLYIWDLSKLAECFCWPIGDKAHYELRVADEGMIDAPMFEEGDVLVEIED